MTQRRSLPSMSETTGHFLDTLRVLVAREFRMRYKGSFFGILWAIISPIGTVIILQFLFTKVVAIGVPHFAAFLYSGILPWTWFQASVQTGSTTLNENRDLVRTPFFSKPLLPWTVTCTNFIFYLFSLPVFLGLMVYEGLPFTNALLVLPVVWIVQWILTLAFTVLMPAIWYCSRSCFSISAIDFFISPAGRKLSSSWLSAMYFFQEAVPRSVAKSFSQ